jgi:hypothetical protein
MAPSPGAALTCGRDARRSAGAAKRFTKQEVRCQMGYSIWQRTAVAANSNSSDQRWGAPWAVRNCCAKTGSATSRTANVFVVPADRSRAYPAARTMTSDSLRAASYAVLNQASAESPGALTSLSDRLTIERVFGIGASTRVEWRLLRHYLRKSRTRQARITNIMLLYAAGSLGEDSCSALQRTSRQCRQSDKLLQVCAAIWTGNQRGAPTMLWIGGSGCGSI